MKSHSGWLTLKAFRVQVVPMEQKPSGKCKYCGSDIYWFKIPTKTKTYNVPFEEAGHGGGGEKALQRHNCRH